MCPLSIVSPVACVSEQSLYHRGDTLNLCLGTYNWEEIHYHTVWQSFMEHKSQPTVWWLSATKPSSFAKSCSIWILFLPLVGLPFILPSLISCKRPCVVSQNMVNPSLFSLPNRVQYLPVIVYLLENFLVSNFIKPTDLFHSSPYPHLKDFYPSSLCLWQRTRLCCIQCYTTDQVMMAHYSPA